MLVARAAKTWARLPPCRAYSFGLMPSLKSSFPPEESSQPIEDASRQAEKWAQAGPSRVTIEDAEEKDMDMEARKKRRQTEWKRRQGHETFLDHVVIHIRGGRGGDGCVAFHREKFMPQGPPSGGNGGHGGDVYILPTPHLTTLSSVPARVAAQAGGHGKGTWMNGKNGPPTIIRVPLGTVVRQLAKDDPRRTKDEFEVEEEALEGLDLEERKMRMQERRWVHYPTHQDDNVKRDTFKDAEKMFYREERAYRIQRRKRAENPIYLDLDKAEEMEGAGDANAPLGLPRQNNFGHLIARGGAGGYGNPHFLGTNDRSPKFATRGRDGERASLSLELKLLADIGLVGMPNAGKSTLLRAVTGGRAKTAIAGYAFTTLNPFVAVVRVRDDGTFVGWDADSVYDETALEEQRERELMESGAYADARTRNQRAGDDSVYAVAPLEDFRFTVADNPGLIEDASDNVGLGHSFLRSIERSPALVYVVDLAGSAPWDELRVLRAELEKYKSGMSTQARMVVANKADLLAQDGSTEQVQEAKAKLARLEHFVREEMSADGRVLDVVPISAKFNMNLKKTVGLMRSYVEEARRLALV